MNINLSKNINKFEIPDEMLESVGIDVKKLSPDQLRFFFAQLAEKGLLKPKPGDKKPPDKPTDESAEGATESGRPGLVKKKVTVRRAGKTAEEYRWVKAGEDEPAEKPKKGEEKPGEVTGELPGKSAAPEKPKSPVIQGLNKPEGDEPEEPEDVTTELEEGESEKIMEGPKSLPDEVGNVGQVSVGDWVDVTGSPYQIDGFDEDDNKVNMSSIVGTKTSFGFGEFNGLVDLIPEDQQEGMKGFSMKLQEGDVVTIGGHDRQVDSVDRNNQSVIIEGAEYSFKTLNKHGKFKNSGSDTFIEVSDNPSENNQMGIFKDNVKQSYDNMPTNMKLPKDSEKQFKTAMDMCTKEGKEIWCLHGVGNDTMVPGDMNVGKEHSCLVKSYNGKWSSHHTHPTGGILSFSCSDICNTALRGGSDDSMVATMQDEKTGMMWVAVPTAETNEVLSQRRGTFNPINDVKQEFNGKWDERFEEMVGNETLEGKKLTEVEHRTYRNLIRELGSELKIKIYSGMPGEILREYDGW